MWKNTDDWKGWFKQAYYVYQNVINANNSHMK